MSILCTFIEDKSPCIKNIELLPLYYIAKGKEFEKLVKEFSKSPIKPEHCDDTHLDIIRLSYGLPGCGNTYKECSEIGDSLHPIVFIFSPKSFEHMKIKSIYPFDTRAHKRGYFKKYLNKDIDVGKNYELPASSETIRSFISLFFGKNKNYLRGRVESSCEQTAFDYEIAKLEKLFLGDGAGISNHKPIMVELQCVEDICITSEIIDAIIMPESFNALPVVEEALIHWEADSHYYLDFSSDPSEYRHTINNKAWERLNSIGLDK